MTFCRIASAAIFLVALGACGVVPRVAEDLPSTATPQSVQVDKTRQVKDVSFLDGAVRFQIPKEWVEEYEPSGTGVYYEDAPDAGTLRVSLITVQLAKDPGPNAAIDVMRTDKKVDRDSIESLPTGNAFGSWVERSSERGDAITMFWWEIVNSSPPEYIRIAMFSYTVLTANEKAAKTASDLALLDSSLRRVRFNSTSRQ
jgi:hypothetical protein